MLPIKNAVEMWARAVDTSKSLDPVTVAKTLENMRYDSGTGMMWMRAEDHQLMQPQYAYLFTKVGPGIRHDIENTGFGWRTQGRIETDETVPPHTCRMERP